MQQPGTLETYEFGVSAIDSGYLRPHYDAVHVIQEGGRAALVDIGTSHSVPRVLGAMEALDIDPAAVDYLFLTHVHLDHAGGAGAMMRHLPNARLLVHERGARHMIDPAKLIAGAVAVYGEEAVAADYGEIVPVAAGRVCVTADGAVFELAGRPLHFVETAGHARHHLCLFDEGSLSLFTGDTFGLSFREFDVDGRAFIFPTSSPVQFEPEAAHDSIERLLRFSPKTAYLTHYSRVSGLRGLADDLHELLDEYTALARGLRDAGPERHGLICEGLEAMLMGRLLRHGCLLPREVCLELMSNDIELNAQGLGVWLDKAG